MREVVAGRSGSSAPKTTWALIAIGKIAQRGERGEVPFQLLARRLDEGQLMMAVGPRPAMPRHVLDDGDDAAGEEPGRDRSAHRGDSLGPLRKRPRPDHRVRLRLRDVEHRGAVDRDSDFPQIVGDQTSDQTGRSFRFGRRQAGLDHAPLRGRPANGAAPSAAPARLPGR